MSHPAPEEDALVSLEERIRRTVELVSSLRAERDAAVGEAQKARAELEALRGERKHVRTRIEKLLGQMDQLSQS
jgi:uncharacterized coiled-coil DUF342 family protein